MTARQVGRMAAKELYEDGEEKYDEELEDSFKQHILSSLDDYLKNTDSPTVVDFSETLEELDFPSYDDWATDWIESEISSWEDQAYSRAKDER